MAKGFKNYNFEFDKNETRMLTSLCKQVIKQVQSNRDYYRIEKAFTAVLEKLNSGEDIVKLTRDEYTQIALHLKENVKFFNDKIKKSWIFKKWMYKSLLLQYQTILKTHFSD